MPRSALQPALFCSLLALASACSTPISPYAQLEDDAEEEDDPSDPPVTEGDAGSRRDAGTPPGARDAGTPPAARDAGPRDAGGTALRDAGRPRDASTSGGDPANCMRVPTAGVASLLLDGCARRPTVSCSEASQTSQQVINQYLSVLAEKCGAPAGVNIGVVFGNDGCPTQLRYEDMAVRGRVSNCLQSILENTRIDCSLACSLIGPAAR